MTEETFARELERRADHVQGAPLTLEDVRGTARGIQRRRRTGAAAVVAAVVAVAILVPTVLTGGGKSSAPDPAPDPSPASGASVLHDGRLMLPDGSAVPLDVDNANVTSFAVLTDGRVVVALQKPYAVRVYARDGSLVGQYATANNTVVANAAHTLAAWVGDDAHVQLLESGAEERVSLPSISPGGESFGGVDAVLGTTCADDGCSVLAGDGTTTYMEASAGTERAVDVTTSEPLQVTDVSPDGTLWAVEYADDADPQFGCSGVYDPEAQEMVARSCETSNLRFSPDGQHLVGARGDNSTFSDVRVYDLELAVVGRVDLGDEVAMGLPAWADAGHLLAAVAEPDGAAQWSVMRIPIHGGDHETVAGPVTGTEFPPAYLLSQ
jgi:hypothetical protein